MITKISTATLLRHNYNNRKHISFKSYNTIPDNIGINSREINSEEPREIFYNYGFDEIPIEHDATYLPSQRYKSTSTFRDEELFDNAKDVLVSQKYLQYSEDDVPLRDDLWMRNSKSVAQYNQYYTEYPETSYENEMQFYPAIHSPWSYLSENFFYETKLKNFISLASLEIEKISGDYTLPNKIFNKCRVLRHGKNGRDLNLCKLALYIFNNSKEWGEVEEQIMDAVKLPIYGKVYGAISYVKYNRAKAGIFKELSNQEILERLKKVSPLDIYRLRGLVK